MKRNLTIALALLVVLLGFGSAYAQFGMMGGRGPGMMWRGWDERDVSVPEKLPLPGDPKWTKQLEEVLAAEKLSLAQYSADQEKYDVYMPYNIIIPQEKNHIRWISRLLAAYGLSAEMKKIATPAVTETKTLGDAYELARGLESNLMNNYQELIKNSQDDTSRNVLGTVLLQTRFHQVMFDHALQMGSFMGNGWMWKQNR